VITMFYYTSVISHCDRNTSKSSTVQVMYYRIVGLMNNEMCVEKFVP